jgi:class 3 adenylate cyclase
VLDGADHFVSGNPDQILDAVEPFLSETPPSTPPAMALAALVAVSGPGSATALPDLTGTGARVRQDAAGRPVLLFDGPAAAVRAALARRRDDVGMGIAVAEVEREATTVRGPGVREATDIADLAPAGEIWLSATVGVLLAGSTIAVEPVGNEQRVLRPV